MDERVFGSHRLFFFVERFLSSSFFVIYDWSAAVLSAVGRERECMSTMNF